MSNIGSGMDTDETTRVAAHLAEREREMEEGHQPSVREIHLDRIQDRKHTGSRRINAEHVRYLVDGIVATDLIHPVVVDRQYRLLAGGHRLAALRQLHKERPEDFARKFPDGFVPVRIIPIDAEQDPAAAWAIEVAENRIRRAYTPAETERAAQQLRSLGYRDSRGRPKPGDKPLMPALAVIMGQSIRTARRKLDAAEEAEPQNRTDVRISESAREARFAQRMSAQLRQAAKRYSRVGEKAQPLIDTLLRAADVLDRLAELFLAEPPPEAAGQTAAEADAERP